MTAPPNTKVAGATRRMAAPGSRSPRRRTQAERRETSTSRLLEAALALLGERRSLDFSLAEVADRAGLSRGMPTHIFGTREAMIRQLVPYLHVRSSALFGPPEARGSGLDAVLRSAALLIDDSPGQVDLTIALHVLLAEAAAPQSPYRAEVRALNRAATSFMERHIAAAIAQNEIAADHCPAATSVVVMAMIRGSMLQWLVDPTVSLDALRQSLLASLRAMLGPHG